MGAILINSDSDMGAYSSIKGFDIINLATKDRANKIAYVIDGKGID
jgi:hypothetical protein